MNKVVQNTSIPVSRPNIDDADVTEVANTVKSTFISAGSAIIEFERQIAKFCGRKYAVAVSNGTQALYLAIRSLNLPPKSKILVPSFTIVSAVYAIMEVDHIPYFIDVDPYTWNITETAIQKSIKEGITAAILVETYSSAPPMVSAEKLLNKNKILIVEDAAEGFGGAEGERKFGSFGNISIISLYSNKLITTGEGGMILTDDESIYARLGMLRNLFFDKERTFIHRQMSGNARMTNYQAALGLSQLRRIHAFYAHRKKLYMLYLKLLDDLKDQIQFQSIPKDTKSSYWVFPILLKKKSLYTANDFIKKLNEYNIEARHFFYPLDKQPFFNKIYRINSKVSESLWKYGLYLPLGNGITEDEVKKVATTVKRVLGN